MNTQDTPRATWRSYDPDLWRLDLDGNRPLKAHARAARDIGALACDVVLAGMKAAREASPRAHVIAWLRTPAGVAHEQAKFDAARAERKARAALVRAGRMREAAELGAKQSKGKEKRDELRHDGARA